MQAVGAAKPSIIGGRPPRQAAAPDSAVITPTMRTVRAVRGCAAPAAPASRPPCRRRPPAGRRAGPGTPRPPACARNSSQVTMPSTTEKIAPCVVARFQYRPTPAARRRRPGSPGRRPTPGRRSACPASRWHRPARTTLNTSTVMRIVSSCCLSLMRGRELAPDVLDEGHARRQQRGRGGAT